jgi:hypothetical protein
MFLYCGISVDALSDTLFSLPNLQYKISSNEINFHLNSKHVTKSASIQIRKEYLWITCETKNVDSKDIIFTWDNLRLVTGHSFRAQILTDSNRVLLSNVVTFPIQENDLMLTQQHNNSESFPQGGYLVFYARATTQDEYFHHCRLRTRTLPGLRTAILERFKVAMLSQIYELKDNNNKVVIETDEDR